MAVVAICDEDPKEIAYTTKVIDEYNLTKPVRDQVIVRAFPSACGSRWWMPMWPTSLS